MNVDPALGFVEVGFLSITALIADAMAKSAAVRLLGFETTGNENIMIRVAGDLAAIEAALETAANRACQLGTRAITNCLPRPSTALGPVLQHPNSINPLYGGRDQFLPSDHPNSNNLPMNSQPPALGILETQGLTAMLQATDVMLKAADVTLLGKEKIGAAYVTVMIQGDVAAVTAAVEAGAKAVEGLGKLIAAQVIARPHADLMALLPKA